MAKSRFTRSVQGGDFYVQMDYRGVGEMLKYREFWPTLENVAGRMGLIAVATAPVSKRKGHSGEYKRSFEVVRGMRAAPKPRVFARLQNTSPQALAVEYGTRATRRKGPAHQTLRKAARAVKGASSGR